MAICHALFELLLNLMLFATLHGAFDDLILHAHMQLGEERAEPGHPDHEVAVFFRVLLGIPEDFGVQHIELNMITTIFKQGPDQAQHIIPAFAGIELIRR